MPDLIPPPPSIEPVFLPRGPVADAVRSSESRGPSWGLILALGGIVPFLLAYFFATLPETQVMAAFIGLLVVALIFAKPFWGLIFFVGLVYIRPEESIPALQGMRLTLMVSLITLVAMIFAMVINREAPVKSLLNGYMLGFGFVAVASTLGLGTTSPTAQEIGRLVILVLLIPNLIRTPDRYRKLITALVFCTAYLALFSIYLYFHGGAMLYEHTVQRSQGTGIFGDPNDLAAAIIGGLALTLSRIVQPSWISRIFYTVLTVIMIAAVLLTHSRGGLLAMMFMFGGFFFVFTKRKSLAMVLAVVVGVIFLVIAPGRMTDFSSQEESAGSRLTFWNNGLYELAHNPLRGVGFGGFPDVNEGFTAHNSFVLCFAELGLPGYFFFIGLIYYGFRRNPDDEDAVPLPAGAADVQAGAAPPPPTMIPAMIPTLQGRSSAPGAPQSARWTATLPLYSARPAPPAPVADPAPEEAPPDPRRRAENQRELLGARLALASFLAACFWISRTYTPVMFLLISLPVAQQLSATKDPWLSRLPLVEQRRDWGRILLICGASILLIAFMVVVGSRGH